MKNTQGIIGVVLLTVMLLSVVAVAFDYCYNSALLSTRCSVCELKSALNGALKTNVEVVLLPAQSCWADPVFTYSEAPLYSRQSPLIKRVVTSQRTDRAPPEVS